MRTGKIYCITNNINNKKYVGKTMSTIEKRFKEHCHDSKRRRCEKRPLYSAMNKYGIENFNIELLEIVNENDIDAREIYWIKQLDTLKNGYNATYGGDGKLLYTEKDFLNFKKDYNNGLTLREIAKKHNCSIDIVRDGLRHLGLNKLDGNMVLKSGKKIIQFDKNMNKLCAFESGMAAARYLIEQGKKGVAKTMSTHIFRAVEGKQQTAYGYFWRYA